MQNLISNLIQFIIKYVIKQGYTTIFVVQVYKDLSINDFISLIPWLYYIDQNIVLKYPALLLPFADS